MARHPMLSNDISIIDVDESIAARPVSVVNDDKLDAKVEVATVVSTTVGDTVVVGVAGTVAVADAVVVVIVVGLTVVKALVVVGMIVVKVVSLLVVVGIGSGILHANSSALNLKKRSPLTPHNKYDIFCRMYRRHRQSSPCRFCHSSHTLLSECRHRHRRHCHR